ncbi:hypothetical protein V3C99_014475 [Haemonchus contortus]
MNVIVGGWLLYLLYGLDIACEGFQCNHINETEASVVTSEMLGKEICKAENACVTNVMNGILTMGCLDSIAHWDNIALCFSAPTRGQSACSYNPETRAGFNRWGVGMCCCREDSCNKLPPEWLALSKGRYFWRTLSIFTLIFTIFATGFFIWGKMEGENSLKGEKKRKKSLKIVD